MATSFADPPDSQADSGDETRDVQVNLNADVSGYTQQVSQAQQATDALYASVGQLGTRMDSLSKTVGRKLVHFSVADFAGLAAGVASAASLERQLGTLRATATVTGSSMSATKSQIDNLFGSFPVARSQVIALTESIADLGITGPKAIGSLATTYTKLGGATGESSSTLAAGGIQLGRQMGNVDPTSLAGYANALLTVSKNQGVAASGVLDFAAAIAPMARQAGIGEAAILGISAAFQKAGADGYYAANTFNSIIGDITQLSQTGSPELAKYSNFVGMTMAQFKAMSGTQQFTSIFNQIAQGGPQALNFVQSLGLGSRAVSSVQAVAQSGDLGQAIAQAQGSSTNTANLDAASKAAFSGLFNATTMVGNQFVRLGEKLGDPLLDPITGLTDAFGSALNMVNKVVDGLQPLPTILASIVGVGGAVAGVALGHAGAVGALAAGRILLGPGSGLRRGYSEGREVGTAIAGGMTREEAMALNESGQRRAAGTLPLRAAIPFELGLGAGQRNPTPGEGKAPGGRGLGSALATGFRAGRTGAGNLLAYLTETQSQFLRDSTLPDYERSAYGERTKVDLGRPGWFRRLFGAGRDFVGANTDAATSALGAAAEQVNGPGAGRRLTAGALRLGQLGGFAARAAGSLFTLPGFLATSIGLPLAGAGINYLNQQSQKPFDTTGAYNHITSYDQLLDKSSSNLAKFGEEVDNASDRLSKFANTPPSQVAKVTPEDISTVFGGGFKPTDTTFAAIAKQSPNNPAAAEAYLQTLAVSHGGALTGDYATAIKQDLLSAYGQSNIGMVNEIMAQFTGSTAAGGSNAAGFNPAALGTAAAGASNDVFKGILGGAFTGIQAGTAGKGDAGTKAKLADVFALGASALGGNAGQNYNQANYQSFTQMMADTFGGKASDYQNMSTPNDYGNAMGVDTTYTNFLTPGQAQQNLMLGFVRSKQGQAVLSGLGINLSPNASYDQQMAAVNQLQTMLAGQTGMPAPATSESLNQLSGMGMIGRFAAGSKTFQAATVGSQSGQPAAQFAAAQQLATEAMYSSTGSFSDATAQLMRLSDAVGGTSTATGALIKSAADWERTLMGFQTPTLSRVNQVTQAYQTYQASAAAAAVPGASSDTVKQAQDDQAAFEQQKESYRQYMISRLQQLQAFTTQQERAQQDENISIAHADRDFHTQQLRSEQDYETQLTRSRADFALQQLRATQDYDTQRLRAQQDYQLQSTRAQQDYQLQVSRQTADFQRDMTRQAEQASETIYDPFIREQTKATTDAGTLIYNLREQNDDIQRQLTQLGQLRKMGISQQTIDTLQLSSADNAQQVNTLVQSLKQNPDMVSQINSLVGTRVTSTTALTQSDYSRTYRESVQDFQTSAKRAADDFSKSQQRSQQDFQTSLDRMSQDFAKSQQRAADDQARTLSRMASDFSLTEQRAIQDHKTQMGDMASSFKLMQDRAADDLMTSLKEYVGDFSVIFGQLADSAAGAIIKYAPQAGEAITKELTAIKAANPWITGVIPPIGGVGGGRGPRAYADGGISLTPQLATVSELGPELHLPLNSRGQDFMTGLIAKSLAQGITMAVSGIPNSQGSTVSHDNSTSFAGANITVEASDPNTMARALEAKAKLKRLTSPTRH